MPLANSSCSPVTVASVSGGPAAALTVGAKRVASGTIGGKAWSLWSKDGETGANALEDAGLVYDGRAYGLCAGYPNPAELELLDAGTTGIVYGVIGYPGRARVQLSVGSVGTFTAGKRLPMPKAVIANGVSFFIEALPRSACDYKALELNSTSPGVSAEHDLGFGQCVPNEIVPITFSQGIWQLQPGKFVNNFAGAAASPPSVAPTTPSAAGAGGGSDSCSTAVAPERSLASVKTSMVAVGGRPFGVATTSDGKWTFVSGDDLGSSGAGSSGQVAVFSDSGFAPKPVRTISLPAPSVAGETLTHDGRYLLAAEGSGAVVVSVARAEQGAPHAVLGALSQPGSAGAGLAGSAIEVVTSPDDHFAFVADEYANELAVFNLHTAIASSFHDSGYVGTIPLGQSVVGMAVSPDGKRLYATSEAAATGATVNSGSGTVTAIDVQRAETAPASAVISTAQAGCGAVRIAVSPDGKTVWVTARESDELLAFSAAKLITAPSKALIAKVKVGEAPVGLAIVDHGQRIVVADSDRFDLPGATPELSVIDTSAALAGKPALLGAIPAGQFPRELSLEPNGTTLLVTNFASGQLEAINTTDLP